ncbi:hypothetical protein ACFXG4_05840 [Nocardia sp. NPDC059246]|uniref:hypothetical protein n=1 Tax=unclassified Nocardia TaxID=2637762 RepID=UPI00369C194A
MAEPAMRPLTGDRPVADMLGAERAVSTALGAVFADKTIAELVAIAARDDLPLNGIRRNNGE